MIDIHASVDQITETLISIPSVIGNEKELADQIYQTIAPHMTQLDRVNNTLIGRINTGKNTSIALVGHLDTVPPTRENHTTPYREDGSLWGLGSTDMKSGLACALKALGDIVTGDLIPKHNIVFIFYEAEEGPLPNGINFLLDADLLQNIDFAYVLEPTEGRYSLGCLGALTMKAKILGISAHSANPRMGENAILNAMKIIEKVEKKDREIHHDQAIDGYPFYETMNVTQIRSDNASNVIPQEVYITVNFRFSVERGCENAKELLYSIIGKENVGSVDCADACYVGNKVDNFLLPGKQREIMQAWTDIAQLTHADIPAVNFGPGSITVAHKPNEHVHIETLKEFYEDLKKHL